MQRKLEAQWAEPVSLTFHSALKNLNTEPSIGASVISNSCFLLVDFYSSFSSQAAWPNDMKLGKKYLWRSSIEIAHFALIHYQTWLPQTILVLDWSISKNLLF
jgi:hypothetical protein